MSLQTHNIVPIPRDGNCLFRAISYFIHGNQNYHREIRLQVIQNIVNKWNLFKDFIVGDSTYADVIQDAIDYQRVMTKDACTEVMLNFTL